MRKERFIIIMAMLFFSITSAIALEIQMSCRPISTTTNGPRRLPSNNNVTLTAHYNEFSGELHFAYSAPSTLFTYYLYIQNTNITGTLDENHDVIKVGNHVTTSMATGDVTTSNANITLRANEILLDSGTYISVGSTLKTVNP